MTREPFGSIELRRTKAGQARYRAHYAREGVRHRAPGIFHSKAAARAWLASEWRLVGSGSWTSPAARIEAERVRRAREVTLAEWADRWMDERPLRPTTRTLYTALLGRHILPELGQRLLGDLTPADIAAWHRRTLTDRPTMRARAYVLLKTLLAGAVEADMIEANPCRVRGATTAPTQHKPVILSPAEVVELAEAMPTKWVAVVLLAGLGGLRLGEILALRRQDIDMEGGAVRVERTVTWTSGAVHVGPPKTGAGVRTVAVPSIVVEALRTHLEGVAPAPDALLWPSARDPRVPSTRTAFGAPFRAARERLDLGCIHAHDLRHSALSWAAQGGASLAALKARAGHSSTGAAMRYQHAVTGADRAIADRLEGLTGRRNGAGQ